MISRRRALALGAAGLIAPRLAIAGEPTLAVPAVAEQGRLVIGHTHPAAMLMVDGKPVAVAEDGTFCFGIAYDRVAPVTVRAQLGDDQPLTRDVQVMARVYPVQHLNGLPPAQVTPPPDVLQRIHDEASQIAAARGQTGPVPFYANGFDWPAAGILSSVYGSQRIDNGVAMAPHLGVDIAAPEGTPIHAPADGMVTLAGRDFVLDGNVTLLDHGQGVSTVYIHQSRLDVNAGDRVRRGQVIGAIGRTGRATGPNLHWGLNWFQDKLDPSRSTPTSEPPKA